MGDGRDGDPVEPDHSIDLEWVAEGSGPERSARRRLGRVGAAIAALVCVVAIAVAIIATRPTGDGETKQADRQTVKTPAARAVFAALGETTATGSYDATSEFRVTPGTESQPGCIKPSELAEHAVSICHVVGTGQAVAVTSHATINTAPYRMMSVAGVSGLGEIRTYVDGTRLWEDGGGNYGINAPGNGPGGPISGFAGLVGGTLGAGPGALTMLTLANPNGYLNLQQEAVDGVSPAGTGTVGDVPVTYYQVTVDVGRLVDVPGLTGEQSKTISEAIDRLRESGYVATSVRVGIDTGGFVRETTSVATFTNGAVMTNHTIFSNFGCAGLVALPGEPPAPPPGPCAPAVPTTTSTTASSTTATSSPSSDATTTATAAPTTSTTKAPDEDPTGDSASSTSSTTTTG